MNAQSGYHDTRESGMESVSRSRGSKILLLGMTGKCAHCESSSKSVRFRCFIAFNTFRVNSEIAIDERIEGGDGRTRLLLVGRIRTARP